MSSPSRGAAGRAAFLDSFTSDDERRAYMRRLGAAGNAARVTLTGEERAALAEAYALLAAIAVRHGLYRPEIIAEASGVR